MERREGCTGTTNFRFKYQQETFKPYIFYLEKISSHLPSRAFEEALPTNFTAHSKGLC